uniref:Uncharacterized protein n=1 Tax=Anguilla anguilla TaxID=7936 RepID=A0A0E9RGC6_ANGAN
MNKFPAKSSQMQKQYFKCFVLVSQQGETSNLSTTQIFYFSSAQRNVYLQF